ncbi:uncharacterized protein N7511_007067 [Penicillium nucicola]|uniref:uncharacterized protein n=1 Tax=Penicillium nucicola TaxID=1850975 RepID=UPI002544D652|nr:uncharacterized protein N7511_007067 [Penicillium nucicola]KAJ5756885.1 hypothetical protein N7511_007067 [Penicillium nucicola]
MRPLFFSHVESFCGFISLDLREDCMSSAKPTGIALTMGRCCAVRRLSLNSPLKDPSILAPELSTFLARLANQAGAPYIHQRPVTFPTDREKKNWQNDLPEPDWDNRDTFSGLLRAKKGQRYTWVALVSSWTSTWVGKTAAEWDDLPWHAWGFAAIKSQRGRGKHIIIWDCDPRCPFKDSDDKRTPTKRPGEYMLPIQRKLLPDSKVSADEDAASINESTSMNREANGEEAEEPASVILEFWDTISEIERQTPHDRPAQDEMIEIHKRL